MTHFGVFSVHSVEYLKPRNKDNNYPVTPAALVIIIIIYNLSIIIFDSSQLSVNSDHYASVTACCYAKIKSTSACHIRCEYEWDFFTHTYIIPCHSYPINSPKAARIPFRFHAHAPLYSLHYYEQ